MHCQPTTLPRTRKGFSIGEVVVASFLLGVGIATVVALVAASFRNSSETKRLIVASELAQEGVELMRNVRDNRVADKQDQIDSNGSSTIEVLDILPGGPDHRCRVGYTSGSVECGGSLDFSLALDNAGFYAHGVGTGRYKRVIRVDDTGSGADEIARVVSLVTWADSTSNLTGGSTGNALNWCTLANNCVYTELLLTAWK